MSQLTLAGVGQSASVAQAADPGLWDNGDGAAARGRAEKMAAWRAVRGGAMEELAARPATGVSKP